MDILHENMTTVHDVMRRLDILAMYVLTMNSDPTIETRHLNKIFYSFSFQPYATIYQ